MSKRTKKDGVGQLVLQIVIPEGAANDRAGETEGNGSDASGASSSAGMRPERKRKWYSLYDKVYAIPNLIKAWQAVAANGGAAGIDRMTIRKFKENAAQRLVELAFDLRKKTYRPQAVRRVYIPKSGGGRRPLGIPTVRDRIVQQALRQILEPIFEGKFSRRSHGFRPERGCATALTVVDKAVRYGYGWVVDADLQAFFDTVDHEKLLSAVNEEVSDGSVLRLIRGILGAGVVEPETVEIEPTELGTPQGGPISPLLANIYLHRFDEAVSKAGYGLVRYADDFVIFARSRSEAEEALELSRQVLEGELGLSLHPEKTRVVSVDEGFEFLGYHYFRDPKSGMQGKEVRRKSARCFREAVKKRTPRLKGQRKPKIRNVTLSRLEKNQQLGEMIRRLNEYLRGWHWYFKMVWSPYATPFRNFDSYVRRRVRSAIIGRTRTVWWNGRITNEMLHSLGLLALDDLQRKYSLGQLVSPARKG